MDPLPYRDDVRTLHEIADRNGVRRYWLRGRENMQQLYLSNFGTD